MSLLDAPMAIIDRIFAHRAAVNADDPAARLVARTTARLRPDARFRRQLRTSVINRYVAEREGLVAPSPPRHRQMGALGRAVLYATFALAVGVSSVGAASMGSLPGDALYGVKLRIEAVRIDIAPAAARPMLAAMALDERLGELEQLAREGRWSAIPAASAAVAAAQETVAAYGVAGSTSEATADLARHSAVLQQLLNNAPADAKPGLERALAASSGATGPATAPGQAGNGHGAEGNGQGQGNPSAGGQPSPHPTPRANPTSKP
jgi:hypothetical protein